MISYVKKLILTILLFNIFTLQNAFADMMDYYTQAILPSIVASQQNTPPIADAGRDQYVQVGNKVILDGSFSSDREGNHLTYSWTMIYKPDGSSASLDDRNSSRPTFIADLEGYYVAELIVNDGEIDSELDYAIVSATMDGGGNSMPIANAGEDQYIRPGSNVVLDGSGSTDPDGDTLTFSWLFLYKPSGSNAVLSSRTVVSPTFTADINGTYVVELLVNDGKVNSVPIMVVINATKPNTVPVADTGSDQYVKTGSTVMLDGSRSHDDDGDFLTYQWQIDTKPDGSVATLDDSQSVTPQFIADKEGYYLIQLVVDDGLDSSTVSYTIVNATLDGGGNTAPVADAGGDQEVQTGHTVVLDGSRSSDADGDAITYRWYLSTKPNGSMAVLSDTSSVNPTFTADVDGTYEIQLIVNDGKVNSAVDKTVVTASADGGGNTVPVADAGRDRNIYTGKTMVLVHHRNPCPKGKVRVQRFYHLNSG